MIDYDRFKVSYNEDNLYDTLAQLRAALKAFEDDENDDNETETGCEDC